VQRSGNRDQAIFCRRRHQPSRLPLTKIRPGSPAPTAGAGTGNGLMDIVQAPANIGKSARSPPDADNSARGKLIILDVIEKSRTFGVER
jgi:hypothetical protein